MRVAMWSALCWMAIVPLAIVNGGIREFFLAPRLGIRVAQPISGLLLIGCIVLVAWVLVRSIQPRTWTTFLVIGLAWGAATFAFELAIMVLQGQGWERIRGQYSFADNNLWPVVMLWVIAAPLAMARLRAHGDKR
jgi:hypothetical protein